MLSTSRLDLFLTPTGKTFVTQADLKELITAYKELKKIKEQTPVAEFVTLFNTPRGTLEFLGRVPDRKLCDLKEGDLLYKQEAIPAQQSPAVAVPYLIADQLRHVVADAFNAGHEQGRKNPQQKENGLGIAVTMRETYVSAVAQILASPSPRITEQELKTPD